MICYTSLIKLAPLIIDSFHLSLLLHLQQADAPMVDRKLKPKLHHDDSDTKVATPTRVKSVPSVKSSPNQSDLKPPCPDRKLKPTTPIKVINAIQLMRNNDIINFQSFTQLETSTLQRRGVLSTAALSSTTDAEFQSGYNTEQVSKTLPRNYNNSTSALTSPVPASVPLVALPPTTQPAQGATGGRQAGVLEYFDLDHSNPPPICNNSNTSTSTSNLNAPATGSPWSNNLSHRLSAVSISSSSVFGFQNAANDASIGSGANPASITSPGSIGGVGTVVSNPPTASGIVYKSVDFIKTEAFMRTRQDAEMARAKNRSKE